MKTTPSTRDAVPTASEVPADLTQLQREFFRLAASARVSEAPQHSHSPANRDAGAMIYKPRG